MAIKSRSIDHSSRAWVDFFRLPFVIEKMHKIEKERNKVWNMPYSYDVKVRMSRSKWQWQR